MSDAVLGEIRVIANVPPWNAPDGWALCNGALLSISDYQALFSLIGTTYGGDGVKNFALPNLCGQVVVGLGNGPNLTPRPELGDQFGTEIVQIRGAEMPPHSHGFNVMTTAATTSTPGPQLTFAQASDDYMPYLKSTTTASVIVQQLDETLLSATGEEGGHSNLMPSLAVYYIIAIEGIYPQLGNSAAPLVTGLSPTSGPPVPPSQDGEGLGSTTPITVTITGIDLTQGGTPTVSFGGVNATIISSSETQIQVNCPAGNGRVPVVVTTSNGSSTPSAGTMFTYVPSITAIHPSAGSLGGGYPIKVAGYGLQNTKYVTFGTSDPINMPPRTVSDTEVQVTAPGLPPGSGQVQITATVQINQTTLTSAANPDAVFDCRPRAYTVQPAYGSSAGGTTVTVSGQNFGNQGSSLNVTFNGVQATQVSVINDYSLTCTTPAGSGQAKVQVFAHGVSPSNSAASFSYGPIVTGFSPQSGVPGTTLTITGMNFLSGAMVTFGSTQVTPASISATSITVVVPNGSGEVPIAVTTSGGNSPQLNDLPFFSFLPTLIGLAPAAGPAPGGTTVVLAGTNFMAGATVMFGGAEATVTAWTAVALTVTVPAGQNGSTVPVTVTTAGGTSNSLDYIYEAIGINKLEPAGGAATGGTTVTIWGFGFGTTPTVQFGTATATNVSCQNGSLITCTTPPGVGQVDITVTAGGVTSSASEVTGFSYVPKASFIVPSSGSNGGGNTISVYGTGFVNGATTLSFGIYPVPASSISFQSESLLMVRVPAGSGEVPIIATTTGGTSSGVDYSYLPSITSLSEDTGSAGGGEVIFITGVGLDNPTAVTFGSIKAPTFGLGEGTIWAQTPAYKGPPNPTHVLVTCAAGTTSPSPESVFTYRPKVTAISPAGGPQGTPVTVTGVGFTGATYVWFGGALAPCTVVSDTQVTATAPSPGSNMHQVRIAVIGANGASSAEWDDVHYTFCPNVASISPNNGGNWTHINLYGEGFDTVTAVYFGDAAVSSVLWMHSKSHPTTEINVLAPPTQPAGITVAVTVVSQIGSNKLVSTPNAQCNYTYNKGSDS